MFTPILILLLCLVVFAVADAVVDVTMFHYDASIFKDLNRKYWQVLAPGKSYLNKYKNRDETSKKPAFPGAFTWLVAFTDGFHVMKQIQILCLGIIAGVLVQEVVEYKAWWVFWSAWALAQVILSVVFHYFFHTVFAAKPTDKPVNLKP